MAMYITVDGGTTNTRVSLVADRKIISSRKMTIGAGARDVDGLKRAVRTAILQLLSENELSEKNIECILASGMITSEYGLCSLAHVSIPADAKKLNDNLYKTVIPEVSELPFVFIRGVKKTGKSLSECDIMRGEETELMGLINPSEGGVLYVLPGSHSKHISVDERGAIVDFKTMMTGELFRATAENTILRDAVNLANSEIREDKLLDGFYYAREHGINEALFKTRILKNILGATQEECYSFLLGCVLSDEVEAILKSEEKTIALGGQKQLRIALALLMRALSDKKIITLTDEQVEASTSLGAIRVFESL